MKYRKKPVIIEAVQWKGDNFEELKAFVPKGHRYNKIHKPTGIITLEGIMTISEGDWIIKGVKGEFYPCKPDIFESTYEAVIEKPKRLSLKESFKLFIADWKAKNSK